MTKIIKVKQIEAMKFYTDIYREASSFRTMWVIKPFYLFLYIISAGPIVLFTVVILGSVFLYLTGNHNAYNNIENIFYQFIVATIFILYCCYKIYRTKHGRPKKYHNYLYKRKAERMLDERSINQLIFDVEYLIEKKEIHGTKILSIYQNFIVALCFPIMIYLIQKFFENGSINFSIFLISIFTLIIIFLIFKSNDLFILVKNLYVEDYYMLVHVKKELEYMKTIKIDRNNE